MIVANMSIFYCDIYILEVCKIYIQVTNLLQKVGLGLGILEI